MTPFIVIFLAFLACSNLISAEDSKYKKDTFENYDIAVVETRNIFEKSIGDFESREKKRFGGIAENIREAHKQFSEELSDAGDTAMKNIENSQAQSDCIAKYMSDVIAVHDKTQESQTACMQYGYDIMESIKNNELSLMQSIREDVANFIAELQECNDEERTIEIGDLKLYTFLETVKEKMNAVLDDSEETYEETREELIKCPETAKYNFFAEVQKINDTFVACN